MPKLVIIAEAGVNHNGDLAMAEQLIDAAVAAGADAVKFQTFVTEKVLTRRAPKAAYQLEATPGGESQFEMIKKLELGQREHEILAARCAAKGIEFLSTPFDLDSVDLLSHLGVKRFKIPSGEITNAPLLLKIAQCGLPIILSTGMSTLPEIEAALGGIAFGYLRWDRQPSPLAFQAAYNSPEGREALHRHVTLLHCTTEYPAPCAEVNLRAMDTLAAHFRLPVGYSDHTEGIVIALAAAARGARIIEKHFTLDRTLPGPDHQASLEPAQLTELVKGIRVIEAALGDGRKIPAPSEVKNMAIARKSLVALTDIPCGELFSSVNMGVKRPGTGISPHHYWDYLGTPARKDYREDELI